MGQKEKTKSSIGYQFRKIIFSQFAALFVINAVWLIAFAWTMDSRIGSIILSTVFSLVYFTMIYSSAGEIADHDKKSYTQLQPNIVKGIMFGVMISALNVLLCIMYVLIWKYFGDGAALTNMGAVIANTFFILWTAPYFGFINPVAGSITAYSIFIMIILPIAATGLGYFAACKNFYFSEKFEGMVYVKKDKK